MSKRLAAVLSLTAICAGYHVENAAAEPAADAPTRDPGKKIEEVIVTALKVEQKIQDVPAAVAVVDGDTLNERGISDFTDLYKAVTGLSITTAFGGPAYTKLGIRGNGGQDDYRPNGNPSVALHVDGVYQTSNAYLGMPFFDLERVEVLKGPQGTRTGAIPRPASST